MIIFNFEPVLFPLIKYTSMYVIFLVKMIHNYEAKISFQSTFFCEAIYYYIPQNILMRLDSCNFFTRIKIFWTSGCWANIFLRDLNTDMESEQIKNLMPFKNLIIAKICKKKYNSRCIFLKNHLHSRQVWKKLSNSAI